uniref:Sut2 n=1 Tax=Arundo donax TaxID=35708 RepID=A0A0A9HG73_ARUDO
MGCSLWGRKHPRVRLGFGFLPGSWCACSSQATEAVKLLQVCWIPWIWLMLELKAGCCVTIRYIPTLSSILPFVLH